MDTSDLPLRSEIINKLNPDDRSSQLIYQFYREMGSHK